MPARMALPLSAWAPVNAATCETTISLLHAGTAASRQSNGAMAFTVLFILLPPDAEAARTMVCGPRRTSQNLTPSVTIAAMFEQFIGTKPVDERHRIDIPALEKYMGIKIDAMEQFKGGQSNPTYRFTDSRGQRYVLRRKPPGKLLPSAHAVDREFRVIAGLHKVGFPVARPHLLCEDESVIGT